MAMLLDAGCEMDKADKNGETPFVLAMRHQSCELLSCLLHRHDSLNLANMNHIRDRYGRVAVAQCVIPRSQQLLHGYETWNNKMAGRRKQLIRHWQSSIDLAAKAILCALDSRHTHGMYCGCISYIYLMIYVCVVFVFLSTEQVDNVIKNCSKSLLCRPLSYQLYARLSSLNLSRAYDAIPYVHMSIPDRGSLLANYNQEGANDHQTIMLKDMNDALKSLTYPLPYVNERARVTSGCDRLYDVPSVLEMRQYDHAIKRWHQSDARIRPWIVRHLKHAKAETIHTSPILVSSSITTTTSSSDEVKIERGGTLATMIHAARLSLLYRYDKLGRLRNRFSQVHQTQSQIRRNHRCRSSLVAKVEAIQAMDQRASEWKLLQEEIKKRNSDDASVAHNDATNNDNNGIVTPAPGNGVETKEHKESKDVKTKEVPLSRITNIEDIRPRDPHALAHRIATLTTTGPYINMQDSTFPPVSVAKPRPPLTRRQPLLLTKRQILKRGIAYDRAMDTKKRLDAATNISRDTARTTSTQSAATVQPVSSTGGNVDGKLDEMKHEKKRLESGHQLLARIIHQCVTAIIEPWVIQCHRYERQLRQHYPSPAYPPDRYIAYPSVDIARHHDRLSSPPSSYHAKDVIVGVSAPSTVLTSSFNGVASMLPLPLTMNDRPQFAYPPVWRSYEPVHNTLHYLYFTEHDIGGHPPPILHSSQSRWSQRQLDDLKRTCVPAGQPLFADHDWTLFDAGIILMPLYLHILVLHS
jgi:hypothetical protein